MGITAQLKQVSIQTLEILKQDADLVKHFFTAKSLPESAFWKLLPQIEEYQQKDRQRAKKRFGQLSKNQTIKKKLKRIFKPKDFVEHDWKVLEQQFLQEWEVPELDLHKDFEGLTFLLSGYVPTYYARYKGKWILPELRVYSNPPYKDFLDFLVIKNSKLDYLPLVNAIGAGKELGFETGYGAMRYLLPDEVKQISDGLLQLTEKGFQDRFRRESKQSIPCPWIDWSEEEMLQWLTDYYNEIVDYYQGAVNNHKAMLLYLT